MTQPVERKNLSSADAKEPTSTDSAALTDDITSPPRLVIPPNRDGALSPTGPAHQPPVSPLRQKTNSPGAYNYLKNIICKYYFWVKSYSQFLIWFRFIEFLDIYTTLIFLCVGSEITGSPTNGILEKQSNCNKGSLRRKTKSAGPALRSSYEAYEERTIPALRQ